MRNGKTEIWRCDRCRRRAHTLYFVKDEQLCENCRRPYLLAMRAKWYRKGGYLNARTDAA